MSDLIVEPTRILEVKKHENADALELAVVKGWQVVIPKNTYKAGDVAIFVPPDAMIPKALAEEWGVWKYLSVKKDAGAGRVKAVRLRGEMSFGFVSPNTKNYPENQDLKETLGITKYEPPMTLKAGDIETDHPAFHRYTDIQNIRNFPKILTEGEEVVMTEKIHGTNSRVGIILCDGSNFVSEFMIGSHDKRRKMGQNSLYETPLTTEVKELLESFDANAIVFGEIFGGKIQDLKYGTNGKIDFRIFDIAVNGKYLNWDEMVKVAEKFGVRTVPVIYRGPLTAETLKIHTNGLTTIMDKNPHMREGVVIKPVAERFDPALGRVVLKSISDEYWLRNHGTENH